MAFGTNFPVAEYLRDHIQTARTISRSGSWWTAILVISDPRSGNPYVALYKWQNRGGDWKKATSFRISSKEHLDKIIEHLRDFTSYLNDAAGSD